MCNRRIVLALESANRYISQCEHGTVSIVWDNLTVRLCPADFAQVVGMVEDACSGMFDPTGPRNGLRLRLGGVLLVFSPEDLWLLQELMSLAIVQMGRPGKADEVALFELPELDSVPVAWSN